MNKETKMDDIILYFSLKYGGDFDHIYRALQIKEPVDKRMIEMMKKEINTDYITILSPNYPEALKLINYPPFVLYYKGDIELLNQRLIACTGTRHPSEYGSGKAHDVAGTLAQNGIVTVTGMGLGIDTDIIEGTLNSNGKTIAVLPCGIDTVYPKSNQQIYKNLCENHLVLSEYPPGITPTKDKFAKRSRLITGLAEKLVIPECERKGATMIKVGFCLDQEKDVICVPTEMGEHDGCNYLISLGAEILMNDQDILLDRNNRENHSEIIASIAERNSKNREYEK